MENGGARAEVVPSPSSRDLAAGKGVFDAAKRSLGLITSSPHHLITSSPHHLITSSPHHLITSSPHHLITSSLETLHQ
jgi:hypothetical protein